MTFTTLFVLAMLAAESTRYEVDLNGQWEHQRVEELSTPPTSGDWQPFQVPDTLRGYDYERGWVRRSFDLPDAVRGKRIKIQFDGVKYNSRIYVNGVHVGGCFNGYDAFEVDATDAVRIGEPNELAVGFHDWTGVFSEGKFDFSEKPAWQRARRYVTDKVIAPIGGHYDHYGVWGDVRLVAHESIYVSDVFIKPSVRRGELLVEYAVTNESAKPVVARLGSRVEDHGGSDVLSLPTVEVQLEAGQSKTTVVRQSWPDVRFWSHEDPYLYHLQTSLSTGDTLRTRFGFREFWIEGHRYVLNGSNVNLLATSWWPPPTPMNGAEVAERWKALKKAGINCFRTHTQPWRRVHYDVADELGLLMIIEGAMWHDPYCTAYHDPTYWDNYAKMIQAMMEREKNRPSVIMWSMENEAYSGEEKTKLAMENLARVGKMAKHWDPTRPIYFESDGDPGGVADAIGMHYVHEYPEYTCWPNEAYWLDKPCNPRTWFGIESEPFLWDRKKPLYIGEFLWVPSGTPANHTVFFGDDAYRDLNLYTRLGKAEAWKMQVLAFRHQEIGGMCPWTVGGDDLNESNPLYRAHQYAYQPIAAYCLDYDRRFFGGDTVARRVTVFNDTLKTRSLGFHWALVQDGTVHDARTESLELKAGEKRSLAVQLAMPKVEARTPITWRLTLKEAGDQVFLDEHAYSVFPHADGPRTSARFGLYAPNSNDTAKLMRQWGLSVVNVESLVELPSEMDVLVIGPRSLDNESSGSPVVGQVDPRRGALTEFMARGGRVLVLRQGAYPEGLFDTGLSAQKSTMTFPLRSSHPALSGITADDLKFWRGDHRVAENEAPRPSSGSVDAIIVSGSKTGIAHAPLLERPAGNGCIVHCQILLVEKAHAEPSAERMLLNLIDYLGEYEPEGRSTLVLGGDDAYAEHLKGLGLRFQHRKQLTTAINLDEFSLVVLRGDIGSDPADYLRIRDYVQEGGQLLVHRPSDDSMKGVCKSLKVDLALQDYVGAVTRTELEGPLSEAIIREDLYWTLKAPGLSWNRQPMSPDITDGILGRTFVAQGLRRYEIGDWKTDGSYVINQGSNVMFADAGTATGEIEVLQTGGCAIGVRARGTPCKGVYPLVQFSVDGKPFGMAQLQGGEWTECGTYGHLKEGRHQLTVAFVNDASHPPDEDRNLTVDAVLVGRDPRPRDIVRLTTPSSTALVRRGQGRVVFDRIRWDTEENNGVKAARYACALLTALNADFTPRPAVTVQCAQMTPQPDMNYYDSRGGISYMGCNGYIRTSIEVAATKKYAVEIVASGDDCDGVCPLFEIHIDGEKRAEVQLTTLGWRSYPVELSLEAGTHELSIVFVNDQSSPTGDVNLRLDKVVFYNE